MSDAYTTQRGWQRSQPGVSRAAAVAVRCGFAVLVATSFALAPQAASATPAPVSAPPRSITSADDGPVIARRRKTKRKRKPSKPSPTAAAAGEANEQASVQNATRQGPTRIEFDERLLQGQTNKANAIYLFQRRESALRSLVKKRQHFHDEIDEALE